MKWNKSESGVISAICEYCSRTYEMDNDWDIANLDWHQCQEVSA